MQTKTKFVLALVSCAGLAVAGCNTDHDTSDQSAYTPKALTTESEARTAYNEIASIDPTLKAKFYDTCYAYAVFPKVGRFGVGIGGAGGEGMVFRGPAQVGTCSLEQVTIGPQVGGQSFREIIFFQDAATLNRFIAGPTEFSANVSAVVIKNGSGLSNNYVNGVAVFVQPTEGVMLEMSIGGQKFWYRPSNAR